jgi:hypothetical protein
VQPVKPPMSALGAFVLLLLAMCGVLGFDFFC